MSKYTTWLKTTAIFQLIVALFHTMSLFVTLPANNETEKHLFTLMDTYKFDLGTGFHRTMSELTLVFSACLCLLGLLAGLLNWHLLRKKIVPEIMKGVININLLVFGILFVLTIIFTFLLPIIQIGLIVLLLIASAIAIHRQENVR